ncbi:MAG: hypothetical protein WBB45_02395 [Cyclobacteriaceae bacterium]
MKKKIKIEKLCINSFVTEKTDNVKGGAIPRCTFWNSNCTAQYPCFIEP